MIDEAPLSMSDQSAFKAWSCANRYSCQLCDYITATRHAFGGHLNIRHKTNIPNYELTFGKFKVKRHQCLLCTADWSFTIRNCWWPIFWQPQWIHVGKILHGEDQNRTG